MDEFLSQHGLAIAYFMGGLVSGGIGGSLLTLRVTRTNRSGRDITDQSSARAGGDIVGGNKNTRG